MYLINTRTLRLEQFFDESTVSYAIISHTWGLPSQEVSFQDMQKPETKREPRFAKIARCCEVADSNKYQYVWIDTCCIDKTSSTDLSEAINSMYRWYQNAQVCYAYLSDVKDVLDGPKTHSAIRSSRWFTRGWTLQELLAPKEIIFYNISWKELGTRSSLEAPISTATGIRSEYLHDQTNTSVATKMSWASKRETSRSEDMAYCLLGLFDVNIPLLYGEGGQKAFRRLQEEILRTTEDESLFAWRDPTLSTSGIFARSPLAFLDSECIIPCSPSIERFKKHRSWLEDLCDNPFPEEVASKSPRSWSIAAKRVITSATTMEDSPDYGMSFPNVHKKRPPTDVITHSDWWMTLQCVDTSRPKSTLIQIRLQVSPDNQHRGFVRCCPNELFNEPLRLGTYDLRIRCTGSRRDLFSPSSTLLQTCAHTQMKSRVVVISDDYKTYHENHAVSAAIIKSYDQITFILQIAMLCEDRTLRLIHSGLEHTRSEQFWPPMRLVFHPSEIYDPQPIYENFNLSWKGAICQVCLRTKGAALPWLEKKAALPWLEISFPREPPFSRNPERIGIEEPHEALEHSNGSVISIYLRKGGEPGQDPASLSEYYRIEVTIGQNLKGDVIYPFDYDDW